MQQIPNIFDRRLLRQRLRRHSSAGASHPVRQQVEAQILERLGDIRRDFQKVLVIGMDKEKLAAALPQAHIISASLGPETGEDSVVLDDETLPFAPHSFDLIISCLHLQWVNDLPGCLAQLRQCLQPDGFLLGCLVGGESLAVLGQCLLRAEEELTGGASPRIAPAVSAADTGRLLQRAGFALPVIDQDNLTLLYKTANSLWHDLRQVGMGNVLTNRSNRPASAKIFQRAIEYYQSPDGDLSLALNLIWLAAWAPHPEQPKPLPRGSGQQSLLDVFR